MSAIAIASFDDEGPFLRARLKAIAADYRILGEWMPFAATSLGKGDGEGGILPAVIVAGLVAGAALFALTVWSAVFAYPLNLGGRPLLSWPAFVPAPVEFAALAAAIGGVAMLFRNAGLTRLHHPAFDFAEVAEASQGAFVLAIGCDAGEDANAALALLAGAGASHSRLIAP